MKISYFLASLFLIGFYYCLIYLSFINPPSNGNEPILRDRFGTTIWHTSDKGGEEHIYCYYPGQNVIERDYILKRVKKLSDCHGWYGTAILYEGEGATEKEKYL